MEIFLVRTAATDGQHLSSVGRQLIRAIGNKLRLEEGPTFDRFLTALAPAAVQTAELFADRVDYVGVVEAFPALAAGAPAEVAATQLLARGTTIAVIGDEPALSALGAFLVGRPTFPGLLPAQVSVIHDRRPAWFLRPDTLSKAPLLVA